MLGKTPVHDYLVPMRGRLSRKGTIGSALASGLQT